MNLRKLRMAFMVLDVVAIIGIGVATIGIRFQDYKKAVKNLYTQVDYEVES